jgi:hypothetical protein
VSCSYYISRCKWDIVRLAGFVDSLVSLVTAAFVNARGVYLQHNREVRQCAESCHLESLSFLGLVRRAEEEERGDSRLVLAAPRDFRPGLSHAAATRLDWV